MLVFLETESQLHQVSAEYPDIQVVVITPGADYSARQLGIKVTSIEDLCDEADLLPISEEIINTVEQMCDYVDSVSRKFIRSAYANEILSLRAFFHFLKQNLDSFVIRVEQILKAIECLSPESILMLPVPPYSRRNGLSVLDKPVLGLTTQLIPTVAESIGIRLVKFRSEPTEEDQAPNNVPRITPKAQTDKNLIIRNLMNEKFSTLRVQKVEIDKPILIHSLFSDLGSGIIEEWEGSGGRSYHLSEWLAQFGSPRPTQQMHDQAQSIWGSLSNDLNFHSYFKYRGVGLWPFFRELSEQIFLLHYPFLLSEITRAKVAFRKGPIVVISGGMVGANYVYGRICARYKKPFFSHHFGGFIGFSIMPTHERYDLAECDYFICGGDGAVKTLNSPSKQSCWRQGVKRAVPVPTGLPWLQDDMDTHRQPRIFSTKRVKRIMLILQALLGDCRFFGHIFMPEIEISSVMFRIVNRLLKEDIEIVIKQPLSDRYPQQTHPVVSWLIEKDYSNVVFADDIELMECINLADAFITDAPSTPLMKLVATRLPILLCVDRKHYLLVSRAKELLEQRCVVFAEDPDSFMLGFDRFLETHVKDGVPISGDVDDRFLYEFGLGDGNNPAKNIVNLMLEQIKY